MPESCSRDCGMQAVAICLVPAPQTAQGNRWTDLGGGAAKGGSYRYDNADGGYYYQK